MRPVERRHRLTRRILGLTIAAGLVAALGESDGAPAQTQGIRVRASAAFAPCLEPALDAFTRQTGVSAALEVGDPGLAGAVDVVVGDDSELTRLLEGGTADLTTAIDLGYLPWVFVSPPGISLDLKTAGAMGPLTIPGGPIGREARASVGRILQPRSIRLSRDPKELRGAHFALVPRSLAGPGETRPAAVRPLVATAAVIRDSPRRPKAEELLAFFKSPEGRAVLSRCLAPAPPPRPTSETGAGSAAAPEYAKAVVDWWLPRCTLEHNGYNDPKQVLGPPDAVALGPKDAYLGFMSLGQGGHVTVDMGMAAEDGPGPDVRIYQMVSGEPVTLYAARNPRGPFVLVGLRVPCGERGTGNGPVHHCDFDLHDAGLEDARYLEIEDGEIFPCLKGDTITEGADIDAVEILNPAP